MSRRTVVVVVAEECCCHHEPRHDNTFAPAVADAAYDALVWTLHAVAWIVRACAVVCWIGARLALAVLLWSAGRLADGIRLVESAAGGGPRRLAPGLLPRLPIVSRDELVRRIS